MSIQKFNNKKEQLQRVSKLHSQGMTNKDIGLELGYTATHAGRLVRMLGLECNGPKPRKLQKRKGKGKCTVCGKWKDLESFENTKHGGKLTSCFACRWMRDKANKNLDEARYLKSFLSKLKSRCKSKNIEYGLDLEYFLGLLKHQKYKCFYTNHKLIMKINNQKDRNNSLSVDRVVFNKGYIKGNIVLCTARINAIKSDMTLDEMKEWTPGWYEKLVINGFVKNNNS